jgi:outer membrane protein OmpA-like peptidoglycan-associated protein
MMQKHRCPPHLATVILLSSLSFGGNAADIPHPKDNQKCDPNPIFERFKGEYFGACERSRFGNLELKRYKDAAKPKAGYEKLRFEGEFWSYSNPIEKVPGAQPAARLEVLRNFENAVNAAKGTVLYVDEGASRVHFTVTRPDGVYWGISGCGGTSGQVCNATHHQIIRVAAMEQSVVVSADQIAKSILDEGKAVFYGLYFDTDKAVLKAESDPTLVEMAKWLKANPKNKVYIVGHTDMQGSTEHTLNLSKARGAAVVEALVKQHGVARERLSGEGVGSFAPTSNNTSDAGRAKNRRVEMVLR